jgi:hypothetical protein
MKPSPKNEANLASFNPEPTATAFNSEQKDDYPQMTQILTDKEIDREEVSFEVASRNERSRMVPDFLSPLSASSAKSVDHSSLRQQTIHAV